MVKKYEKTFKFTKVTERVTGESRGRFTIEKTKKNITPKQAETLIRKGSFGSFKQYAFWFEKGKFRYGMKKLKKFKTLLNKIGKESKKRTVQLGIYER